MTPRDPRWADLAARAERMRKRSHAPYSRYRVGAALLTTKGVALGCNVENASYPLCMCAEAGAVAGAVARGWTDFVAIAVATEGPEAGSPCGACRQILAEFGLDTSVGLVVGGAVVKVVSMRELRPFAFNAERLPSAESAPRRPRATPAPRR